MLLTCYVQYMLFIYYRGGKICLTDHFKPLWARNVPKFGIAHCMALGVWLYLEIHVHAYQNYILRMHMLKYLRINRIYDH